MSQLSNIFDNLSRIGLDECDTTNKQIQNTNAANYMLDNFSGYNNFSRASSLATNQPNVFLNGSLFGGINSTNIDENSSLQIRELSRPKERNIIQERLFKSTPYLGKGPYDVESDIQICNNELNSKRKTEHSDSETMHDNYTYYPLIPSIETSSRSLSAISVSSPNKSPKPPPRLAIKFFSS